MKNRSTIFGIILLLLFSSSIPFVSIYEGSSNDFIYVDGDGTADYVRIQDAIDNASEGDTIFVYNGTYYENIIIDKPINLIGEDTNNTIIRGDGINNIVTINSDWIDISGFNICNTLLENSKEPIVCVSLNSSFSMIHNNILYNCSYGIYLNSSSNNKIYKNIIYKRGGICGIFLFHRCSNNSIFENMIYDFDYWGIYLWNNSNNNMIYDNNFISSHQTITIDNSNNNIIHNNTIDKSGHGVGMWLIAGKNNEISGNFIENITYGIVLDKASNYNIIKNNIIQNNMDGINIWQKSDNNIVMNNIVSNNRNDGIYIAESKENSVQLNNITNNGQGVNIIRKSIRNTIIANNFENNKVNALFHSSYLTTWDMNYWGQPRDTPYMIWGRIGIFNSISIIPWVQFDRNPAQEPYDMPFPEVSI